MIKSTISKNCVTVEVQAESAQELAALIQGAFGTGSNEPAHSAHATRPARVKRAAYTPGRKVVGGGERWSPEATVGVARIVLDSAAHPELFHKRGGMTTQAIKFLKKNHPHQTRTYGSISTMCSAIKRYLVDGEKNAWLSARTKRVLSEAGLEPGMHIEAPVARTNYLSDEPVEA